MQEKHYVVYMHTLVADGRKYIGVTNRVPNQRWRKGEGYYKQPYFYNTIKKYGWDAFKHDIIFSGLTQEQACIKEKALIKLFNTTEHSFGFNMTKGGDHYEFSGYVLKHLKVAGLDRQIAIPYEDLYLQYITLNKSIKDCAQYFNCSQTPIKRLLTLYNLHKSRLAQDISKQELNYQYNILGKTQKECAEHFKTTRETIRYYLKKFNLYQLGISHHATTWAPRYKYNIPKEELEYQYVYLNKSMAACAEYFGCSLGAIANRLKKYGIKIKT